MNTKGTTPPWLRRASIIALPLVVLVATAVFFSQPIAATQPIVKDVKPLPIMQQATGRILFEANCAKCFRNTFY